MYAYKLQLFHIKKTFYKYTFIKKYTFYKKKYNSYFLNFCIIIIIFINI